MIANQTKSSLLADDSPGSLQCRQIDSVLAMRGAHRVENLLINVRGDETHTAICKQDEGPGFGPPHRAKTRFGGEAAGYKAGTESPEKPPPTIAVVCLI